MLYRILLWMVLMLALNYVQTDIRFDYGIHPESMGLSVFIGAIIGVISTLFALADYDD